jgi:FkbM family methyltransferase
MMTKILRDIFHMIHILSLLLIHRVIGFGIATIVFIIALPIRLSAKILKILPEIKWKVNKDLHIRTSHLLDLWHNLSEYFVYPDFYPKKGDIVLDIGSYIGGYAKLAASLVSPNGKVVAVEANPVTFRYLLANIIDSDNLIKNIIEPVHALIYGDEREIKFYIGLDKSPASSIYVDHISYLDKIFNVQTDVKGIALKSTTIDNIIYGKNLHNVMLKIDTEGAELEILRGSIKSIKENRIKKAIIEIHYDVNNVINIISFIKEIKPNSKVKIVIHRQYPSSFLYIYFN